MIRIKAVKIILLSSFVLLTMCKNSNPEKTNNMDIKPPVAEKIPKELTIHSDTRIDNYYWLNERDNPKVIEYLEAENAYCAAMMKHTEAMQDSLYNEIIGRIKQDDSSVPYKKNGYWYYTRYEEGKEYAIYCRKKESMDATEEILLDVNKIAEGHEFYQVSGFTVSTDNNLLAFGIDTVSRRLYTVYVKNLSTGEILKDKIENTSGNITWANDNKTLFYAKKDTVTLRSDRVMKHNLGTETETDKEVFVETDNTFSTYVYKTKSERFLVIGSSSTLSTEYLILDADDPDGEFKVFNLRESKHEYYIAHFEDKFYIITNWEAENFRLMETPVNKTGKENWKEVIPHSSDVFLENIEIFRDFLVVDERKEGLTRLRIINMRNNCEYYVDFEEETYSAGISVNPEFDTGILRFNYTSLTTPFSVYNYNMKTREKTLLKQKEVVGDFKPGNYEARRIYATASDGVKVPISLVYREGLLKKDGNNPLLLYGYGSYGHTIDPSFSSVRLSLLDRGFVYAIAHIRGGQVMGRHWYEDGKLLKKNNTFTDFIACTEYLVNEKYTNPEKCFALGGSAGGLLMGAVVNTRPDLYKAIVAEVPWVDVVTTMLDESIPLTTSEFDEWGNPENKEYYDYMLSYSPYDNVAARDYPAMLVLTGLHDSQVQYFEPAKWVAKLRDMKTDDNLLLLHINMDTGHGGASGRFKYHKETAMIYAFYLNMLQE